MIIVDSGNTNILYFSRFSQVDKWEILDHNSRVVDSGLTTIVGYNGKINHTGITYQFEPNNVFTYKSYYIYNNIPYLANHSFIQSYDNSVRMGIFKEPVKNKNTFKTNGK